MTPQPAAVEIVAAILAPGGSGIPGALDVDIVAGLAEVLDTVPALAEPVGRAFDLIADDPAQVLALESTHPALFTALLEAVLVAWAISPGVQAASGAPARTPIPIDTGLASQELLQIQRDRGPRWIDPGA